jgi:hypothetical protein
VLNAEFGGNISLTNSLIAGGHQECVGHLHELLKTKKDNMLSANIITIDNKLSDDMKESDDVHIIRTFYWITC